MSGQPRTSKTTIIARILALGASLGTTLFYILGALGVSAAIGPIWIGGIIAVSFWVLVMWGIIRLLGWAMSGHDPDYQQYISEGGDPYFDGLPPPFNMDSVTQRVGGLSEPITDFVPPEDWQYQCMQCGARVEHEIDTCWNCGNGNDIEQCHGCGMLVKEPSFGAFKTTGVICPQCNCLIRT
ncbi:hypothetical protein [Gimesia chilikensis]|uniref:Zinc ribbon domain-containing protein n=1 Tax=Gimesia chilikensis TaxID=2605989 RepID=A0A517PYF7_9PLAN|nr:hypothetical protein [Gimesia chilikensis]QDT24399.1 hypothetical protein HG66A1_62310 [Gimesia chilikensis]